MDIPQTALPSTGSVGTVNSVTQAQALAIQQAQSLDFLAVAPTTVDLSTLGRFVSLASLLQKKTLDLQASLDAGTDAAKALADVTASATAVLAVFQELQSSAVDNTG
jgi:hypothetical protein